MKCVRMSTRCCSQLVPFGRVIGNFIRRNFRFCIFTLNLYVITFAMVLPILCNDWAYSKYYFPGWTRTEMESRAATLNEIHASQAEDYITRLNATQEQEEKVVPVLSGVDLTVGIVTIPRSNPSYKLGYLTQSFVRMHQNMLQDKIEKYFPRKKLFLCDTNPGPGNHRELKRLADVANLNTNIQVFTRFPKYNATAAITSKFEKEKQDYVYCLDVALTYNPKYVLIIEDDTLARDNLFEILHHVLTNLVESRISSGDHRHNTEEWAYLKLFYPDRWKGYAFELMPMLEIIAIGSVGGSLFVMLASRCNKRKDSVQASCWVHFMLGSVYFVCLAYLIGRPYVLEWRRISKYTYTAVPAPDCCSPAILYTAQKAHKLSTYLKTVKCAPKYPMDFAIDRFAQINNYKKYLIEPNLMQHIGMFSSLKTKSRFPEQFIYR